MKGKEDCEPRRNAEQQQSPERMAEVPPLLRRKGVVDEIRCHAAYRQRREPEIGLPPAQRDHGGGMGGGYGHERDPGVGRSFSTSLRMSLRG